MSSFTFYDGTVPHATAAINVLLHLFNKIEAHASSLSSSVDTLISARLAEDMLPFSLQVFIASEMALQMAVHLQGLEPPTGQPGPDGLKTLEDMRKRVHTVLELLQKSDRQKFIDAETEITFNVGPEKKATANAHSYANGFALPNLYFHTVTAYNILRKHGVQVGKTDYLNHYLGGYLF
ncbi:hypothetical protein FOYG_16961 [Fusarium oxysporum NRRL 32931]|uniref:DUF1993 domain-containing protein n=1 Tax=Fusarium oxysporum NRRL 32931 TaxID=660029 RepID=W9HIA8_FUSOX|nr:hypothetical protein FOYG_16961 [Fusarium oxysporum NRRL 32931]